MRLSAPVAAVLTVATVATVVAGVLDGPSGSPGTPGPGAVVQLATAAAEEGPGRTADPRSSAHGYAFFSPNRLDRIAASWDRDVPVTYLIGTANARPRMFATIKEAFRRARVQTGIRFRYGGRAASSEPVGTVDQPVVLVDFGTASGHPRLAKYHRVVYAVGGPFLITDGASGWFTGGQITIDVGATRGIGRGFRHAQLGATLLHEVGHVLGLAHVDAPGQLMAPGWVRADISGWFHDGDLRGLRRLIHD
jgi:hypothetical protein